MTRIADGSPAEAVGMAEGDIILEISKVETNRIEDLVNEIQKRKIGEIVRFLALRNGGEHFFESKLSEAPYRFLTNGKG
jgi:S1-C subfamily serine protease